jgi:hypothetical protein
MATPGSKAEDAATSEECPLVLSTMQNAPIDTGGKRTHPGWPQEGDVLPLVHEPQLGQLRELLLIDRGLKAEVKVGQALREGEAGQSDGV